MLPFGAAIFLSAFLLFVVQPLIGRFVVPAYGGTPAAWSVTLLFFQVSLLVGYAYAHLLNRRTQPRTQAAIHGTIVVLAALMLPLDPAGIVAAGPSADPTLTILVRLVGVVGLPLVALAATGPLLQIWYVRLRPGRPPWWMYAISNGGSLLALIAYPFVIERRLGRDAQAVMWSVAFVLFVALAMWCAWSAARLATASRARRSESRVGSALRVTWIALAGCGVWMLMSVTNRMTLDLAPVPLLWVVPLSLYLLTYVVTFAGRRGYSRRAGLLVLPLSLIVLAVASAGSSTGIVPRLVMFAAGLAGCCWVLHGELYRLRPAADRLTGFYLAIASGGVIGGTFVTLIAPNLMPMYWEFQVGQAATVAAVVGALVLDRSRPLTLLAPRAAWVLVGTALGAWGVLTGTAMRGDVADTVVHSRSFFGVSRIYESDGTRRLIHGTTNHGMQWVDPERRSDPVAYYGPGSGVGRWLAQEGHDRRIGVVGLGTGTLAAWGRPGDQVRFYEIDPEIERIARDLFWYLDDSAAEVEVVIGDGRVMLGREPAQAFDLLVLDAFSSDSIPTHLLTIEAFEIYQRHLARDGVIAVHITNRYVDLAPVVAAAGRELGLHATRVIDVGVSHRRTLSSDWIMLSGDRALLGELDGLPSTRLDVDPWTDDFSNVVGVLR